MMRGMGGIYQRAGKWYYRTRLQGGRLYRESLAKYGITTEAQAKAYLREMEKAKLEGRLAELDPSTRNLGHLISEYLAYRQPLNLAADTKRRDRQALRSLISVVGEKQLLRSIRQRHIDQWAGVILAKGTSATTINSYLRHIRAALGTAVEWGWLERMPRLKPLREPKRLPPALTPQEAVRLLYREKDLTRRALWRFFLWTGARRQEVLDLRWEDVHLEGQQPWARLIGKGDKERLIPLVPGAVRALESMPKAGKGPVWVFITHRGRKAMPVKGWAVSTWFKEAARAAGLPDRHLHDLRHTAATWMAARGVSERIIQEVLGHASITTTQIYTRGLARVADLYREVQRGLGTGITKVSQPRIKLVK